ncbi:MAG: right-handed parallel beta-helix repeat-containing protein [Bdellovibrionales bacterium]|nr:right-handed parallel beta-helix repeat-containing protein [Bdellovibrionales bacterium]
MRSSGKTSFRASLSLILFFLFLPQAAAQDLALREYDIGSPTLSDLWVDPVAGNDSNSGATRGSALRTVTAAWQKIPQGTPLTGTGYRVNLVAGDYPESALPNFWEERFGTAQFPIIFQAADGRGTANFLGDINALRLSYFYLIDFDITPNPAGDAFHCELCDHVLLRGMELSGGAREAQETIKVNQSQYIYVEDCTIHGAGDNAVDYVAVQYGHLLRNTIYDAQDWCVYVKGGSAYIALEQNLIHTCGTGGFTAGQGTGFEFMSSPWLHYEAYDIKFVNNIVRDTEGAAFGVNGGYNILIAHNTAYRVGSRSHMLEVVYGLRTCDGNPTACSGYVDLGGWGTRTVGPELPVGNRNVFIYNNIFYNPSSVTPAPQHFSIQASRTIPSGTFGPSPVFTDTNLRIRGNLVFNGNSGTPVGVEGNGEGCDDSNPTCTLAQLLADNQFNVEEPQLTSPSSGDFRPVDGGTVFDQATFSIPSFPGGDREATPLAPEGILENAVTRDFSGAQRLNFSPVGAYAGTIRSRTPADVYLPWNSFLQMQNVLEMVNSGTTAVNVVATLFDINGNAAGQQSVAIAAGGQFDLLVNLLDGFATDSYGVVTLDVLNGTLQTRMSFYRQSGDTSEYDFAYAIPGSSGSLGNSYVPFNTFQPSRALGDAASVVANFLSIVNYDGTANRTFQVNRYSDAGELLRTDSVSVGPFGRTDIEAGHVSPGPSRIGLLEIVPASATAPYSAFLVRYGERASVGPTASYAFAFPLLGRTLDTEQRHFVPISVGGSAQNWVELANATSSVVQANARFFDQVGNVLGETSVSLPAHAQVHVNINSLLADGAIGHAELTSEPAGALIAQSMFYFFTAEGGIAAMYGTQDRALPGSGTPAGSYNLFLGMFNYLKLVNPTTAAIGGNILVNTSAGVREVSFTLPAHGAADFGLHEALVFGTEADSYGLVRISGGSVLAEVLRLRPSASGGFDYVFPTPVE